MLSYSSFIFSFTKMCYNCCKSVERHCVKKLFCFVMFSWCVSNSNRRQKIKNLHLTFCFGLNGIGRFLPRCRGRHLNGGIKQSCLQIASELEPWILDRDYEPVGHQRLLISCRSRRRNGWWELFTLTAIWAIRLFFLSPGRLFSAEVSYLSLSLQWPLA